MPLLSVIIPVYNVEKYLARCIESVLGQTYTDFECILVNDGTRDQSAQIMADYASKDARIRTIHKANGGLSSARNAGLDKATGKYIIFLDSDDYADQHLFEEAINRAEKTGAQQVLWNYARVWDDHEEGPYLSFEDELIDLDVMGLDNYFYKYFMPYRHGQEAWSKLYLRDVIERNGLRFAPNDEIFAEDTLFSAMYLLHTQKIAAISRPFIYYYQRGDSLMGMKKPQLCKRLICLGVRLSQYAEKIGRYGELRHVLPVFCYDKLFTKGIRFDPSDEDVYNAMRDALNEDTLHRLLNALISPMPLLRYTLRTGKGFRTQVRARLFAYRWLHGDVRGAVSLVQGRDEA